MFIGVFYHAVWYCGQRNSIQVELFFKWIKQHLRIKAFYGTSENAVKVRIPRDADQRSELMSITIPK